MALSLDRKQGMHGKTKSANFLDATFKGYQPWGDSEFEGNEGEPKLSRNWTDEERIARGSKYAICGLVDHDPHEAEAFLNPPDVFANKKHSRNWADKGTDRPVIEV
jgi:hypothetical protein